jgi:RNA exonuclease 4
MAQHISKMFSNMRREKLLREVTSKQVGWYVALDCEMVGTGALGSQSTLARVSMVDWDGHIILDTFVKVPVSVTDYRTHISGVTPQHLESEQAMDLEDVRYIVQKILHGRVLIGHGLDNDLSALMISHPSHDIRDTACYIPYMQVSTAETNIAGRKLSPRKLKDLVKDFLGWTIQGTVHNSVEDALATLALYKKARPEWEAYISRKLREERRKENQLKKVSIAPSKKNQIAPIVGNRFSLPNQNNTAMRQTNLSLPENVVDIRSSLHSALMYPPNNAQPQSQWTNTHSNN